MKARIPFNFKELFTLSSLGALILCYGVAYLLTLFQPQWPPAQSTMLFWVQVSANILALSLALAHLGRLYARQARHIRLAWLATAITAAVLSVVFVLLFDLLLNAYQQQSWGIYVIYGLPALAIACGIGQLTFIPAEFSQLRETRREFLVWRNSPAS